MPITQLPPTVVNKIAAGEVIERPASVVKELLENAVDAGATRIDVSLDKGGCEAIRVVDNGCGIPPEELPLAVASHATSKILSADDLFSVGTLGFRGEALASIASVSRLLIRSRPVGADAGAELELVGGEAGEVAPAGCPQGTSVEVRSLFYNTPVRHRFLRTTQTEVGHVTEAFTRIALARPDIHMTLAHNGRTVHDLPPTDALRTRVAAFFGGDLADALIHVESQDDDVRLSGYVAHPSHSRASNRMQYLFLNGRAIRDRALQHALGEAYRGLLLVGRWPICFLRLDMPPDLVDVNVHPTKQEVRFQDSGRLYSQLLGTLRTKFLTSDLSTKARLPDAAAATQPRSEVDEATAGPSELVDWAKRQLADSERGEEAGGSIGASGTEQGPPAESGQQTALRLHRLDVPPFRPFAEAGSAAGRFGIGGAAGAHKGLSAHSPEVAVSPDDAGPHALERHDAPAGSPSPWHGHAVPRALQIHNRYLVVESSEGLEVIDQHALHERILFEQVREKVLRGALEVQRLLVPEPVDLAAAEAAAVLEHAELLLRLGVEVQPFGGETVLVLSYPAMLANLRPAEVLQDLAVRLSEGGRSPQAGDLLEELLHSVACRAAVKYGDRLSDEEISSLLDQRQHVQDEHHCPHGRPTSLRFSREELDRQFKRI